MIYTCPLHGHILSRRGPSAICPECVEPYAISDDVWILDIVHRNDRLEFDKQVDENPIELDLTKAEHHLAAAGVNILHNATILDLGCGLGDMTLSLSSSPRVTDSDIYAVDHSVQSVRKAAAAVNGRAVSNRAHFSTQDASRLFFRDSSFNFVVGSAVLHHITDYSAILREIFRLLKPNGTAVFSEPFLEGYFWPCYLLQLAADELRLPITEGADFGLGKFVIENTVYRMSNATNLAALDGLTDKHYFRSEDLLLLGREIGFSKVQVRNAESLPFYTNWMAHFMDVYGVQNQPLRYKAIQYYESLTKLAGSRLTDLVSHFKYMVFEK